MISESINNVAHGQIIKCKWTLVNFCVLQQSINEQVTVVNVNVLRSNTENVYLYIIY